MYDTGKILPGLLIFLVLITFPFWYDNVLSGNDAVKPDPKIVTAEKECVAPTAYMKSSHMELLNTWRNSVVRENDRIYVSPDGKRYEMSLVRTCLEQCHTNKDQFCDNCHTFMAVSPYCWNCHVEVKDVTKEVVQR
jgi:hypothetical protein